VQTIGLSAHLNSSSASSPTPRIASNLKAAGVIFVVGGLVCRYGYAGQPGGVHGERFAIGPLAIPPADETRGEILPD